MTEENECAVWGLCQACHPHAGGRAARGGPQRAAQPGHAEGGGGGSPELAGGLLLAAPGGPPGRLPRAHQRAARGELLVRRPSPLQDAPAAMHVQHAQYSLPTPARVSSCLPARPCPSAAGTSGLVVQWVDGVHAQRYVQLQHAAAAKQLGAAPASGGGGERADSAPAGRGGGAGAGGERAADKGYSGPAGQRARREVLAELLERAQQAAQLLVPPLLDDGAGVLPPGSLAGQDVTHLPSRAS